ncbi:hypothetical protein ACLB1S_16550 [Escherichia coli]
MLGMINTDASGQGSLVYGKNVGSRTWRTRGVVGLFYISLTVELAEKNAG